MRRRLAIVVAVLALAIGLIASPAAAPAAPMRHSAAATVTSSYEWVHSWDYTGTGVTIQYASSGFSRTSYVHSNTCTEEWLNFWPGGNVALYYRHANVSFCDGVAWSLRWTTAPAGTSASLSWQHDGNIVLRRGDGTVIWSTNSYGYWTGHTSYRHRVGTNGYMYWDTYELCCYWQNRRVYPGDVYP